MIKNIRTFKELLNNSLLTPEVKEQIKMTHSHFIDLDFDPDQVELIYSESDNEKE